MFVPLAGPSTQPDKLEAIRATVGMFNAEDDNNLVNAVLDRHFPEDMPWCAIKQTDDWAFAAKLVMDKAGVDMERLNKIGRNRVHYQNKKRNSSGVWCTASCKITHIHKRQSPKSLSAPFCT